jgi:mRNA interferase RelE/StbE
VSHQVIWDERAIDQAAGLLADDPAGLGEMLDAVGHLADDPQPPGSFHRGEYYRLSVGRYRVLYEVTEDAVSIRHLARHPSGR